MEAHAQPDPAAVEAFGERVLNDASAATVTILAALGDRLGLFKDLFTRGSATSTEFAIRNGIGGRYAREWLAAMASAGYLRYDPGGKRFALPSEHAPALARENGPLFLGGILQMLPPLVGAFDRLAQAFHKGGGVPQSAFDEDLWEGMERFSAVWFENVLIPQWVPAMPDVEKKLRAGVEVADVGCGRGRALMMLAQSFPESRYDGYDSLGQAIALARKNARMLGVADRIRFEWRDASDGLPSRYDVITTFDMIHEAVRPKTLMRRIREALNPGGIYVCLEANCSENLEENAGPLGAMRYGFSVLYCMTTSLAAGGEGLGAMGLPEPIMRELCAEAGFASMRRVPIEDPFNALYEIRR
jgi:2-polyprenyl-3-methyl-5-hydroxy-6-metoxy-1,4-benzoquinol methylase